jgi:hypothetical protein
MSVDIFAAKLRADGILAAVIDSSRWEPLIYTTLDPGADDGDDTPPIPNPLYIEDAAINVSNANAEAIRDVLGLDPDTMDAPIDAVQRAALRWLNSASAADETGQPARRIAPEPGSQGCTIYDFGRPADYLADRLTAILRMAHRGRSLGATHIVLR